MMSATVESSSHQPLTLQQDSERLLKELVDVSSPTTEPTSVNHVQTILSRELQELGFEIELQANPDPACRSGDLLVATLPGESSSHITFVSHSDTVLDIETTGRFTKTADGQRATGSGVIDNKGGLVVAIMGVKLYLGSLGARRPPLSLRFVISPNEEAGSLGFQDEFRRLSQDSVMVLGFEPALENGSIVESRRGNRWYQVHVKGQEAHAGRCRGEQINAAHDLAIKIAKLHKLNRPSKGVAVNVAQFEGGRDRFNVVCGFMSAKIDARFPSFKAREALHQKIEKTLLKAAVRSPITGLTSQTSYTIEDDCPPFSSTRESRRLLKLYLREVSEVEGRSVRAERAGGAGDVNYMSREGVVVFDGLGPIGGKMHTPDEFIQLSSLSSRATALFRFLRQSPKHLRLSSRH